jgi:hypothetical protein
MIINKITSPLSVIEILDTVRRFYNQIRKADLQLSQANRQNLEGFGFMYDARSSFHTAETMLHFLDSFTPTYIKLPKRDMDSALSSFESRLSQIEGSHYKELTQEESA